MLVNGLLAILFGGIALFATEATMLSISMYFGLLVLIGGILLVIGAYDLNRKKKSYTLMFTEGIISVLLGSLIIVFPGETLKIFFVFIGIWALLLGIFKLYLAVVIKEMTGLRYSLIIGGILLFAIGLLLLLDPNYVVGMILKIIGVVFILIGMILVYFSISVRVQNTDNN